jgi:16S rRNA (guanine(966)-N(2))-methyltransferase RsmD
MSLKITGGRKKGKSIDSPSGMKVRPTASKIRQALFNVLGGRVAEAKVLDLFGGTGLMGIEALSRGAAELTTIEVERKVATGILNAFEKLAFENARVVQGDFREKLGELKGNKFDIIFADPPYDSPFAKMVINLVDKYELLSPNGVLIIEHNIDTRIPMPEKVSIKMTSERNYGQTCLSFFEIETSKPRK